MSVTSTIRSPAKPLILIVEDQPELGKLIANYLENAGLQAQICSRGDAAVRFLKDHFANLMLLDIDLPDQSGFAVLEKLKKEGISVPTIFLTGDDEESSKLRGLEMGGDDYVTKPFSYAELIARINAVLRRAESASDQNITKNVKVSDSPFEFCGSQINPQRLEVTFPKQKVTLNIGRKELGIIAYLHAHQGEVITRQTLIHSVWGIHADITSRSLDQYIVKIRELFGEHGLKLDRFRTVHGVGYIFDPTGVTNVGE